MPYVAIKKSGLITPRIVHTVKGVNRSAGRVVSLERYCQLVLEGILELEKKITGRRRWPVVKPA